MITHAITFLSKFLRRSALCLQYCSVLSVWLFDTSQGTGSHQLIYLKYLCTAFWLQTIKGQIGRRAAHSLQTSWVGETLPTLKLSVHLRPAKSCGCQCGEITRVLVMSLLKTRRPTFANQTSYWLSWVHIMSQARSTRGLCLQGCFAVICAKQQFPLPLYPLSL